jgi:hypothetical protein
MGKEYNGTDRSSGGDIYAQKQFDSSKTIDVLEREKDPLRRAEQQKSFSIGLAVPLRLALQLCAQ